MLRIAFIVCLVLIGLFVVSGCDTSNDEVSAEDRAAIKELLAGYLPSLAEAYRSGNVEALRPYAVEKEMATIYKRISDLMRSENRIVASTLKSFELEEVTVWNHSNAFATTMEIWDVQTLASGSEVVLSEAVDQRNRVRYQFKRTDDGWRVIYREREQNFE